MGPAAMVAESNSLSCLAASPTSTSSRQRMQAMSPQAAPRCATPRSAQNWLQTTAMLTTSPHGAPVQTEPDTLRSTGNRRASRAEAAGTGRRHRLRCQGMARTDSHLRTHRRRHTPFRCTAAGRSCRRGSRTTRLAWRSLAVHRIGRRRPPCSPGRRMDPGCRRSREFLRSIRNQRTSRLQGGDVAAGLPSRSQGSPRYTRDLTILCILPILNTLPRGIS